MKKLLIIVIIIGILGGSGYFGYTYLSTPSGFTTKEEVIQSFFENLNDPDVCQTHYDTFTAENCAHIVSLLKDDTVVVTNTSVIGGDMNLSVRINGNPGTFVVNFVTEPETGMKARFNPEYYKIYYME